VGPPTERARGAAAQNLSHDCRLTVNDRGLYFLNFFQRPRGRRAIVGDGLRRAGAYARLISARFAERQPARFDYLAQAESAFQPLACFARGGAAWAICVAWRWAIEYGLPPHLVGGRPAKT